MGLVIKNLKYKNKIDGLTFTFKEGELVGLQGPSALCLMDIIDGNLKKDSGSIELGKEINANFYKKHSSDIAYINVNNKFLTNRVVDEFKFIASLRNYENDILDLKINNMLKLVGLNASYLERDFYSLSSSEKILIDIAINLLYDPKVIMLGNIFGYLDYQNQRKVLGIIRNLKDAEKIVILYSVDVDLLYQYTDKIIIFDQDKVVKSGDTMKVYTSKDVLDNQYIDRPSVALITKIARDKKKVNLMYQRESRDIIKDIYKHV